MSAISLLAITFLVLVTMRTRPYLMVGWFWYLITALPVIGIIQVGEQARADRYTYIPGIGLSIMLAWSVAEVWQRWPQTRPVWAGLTGAAGLACVLVTGRQISYWEDSHTLFQQTLLVTQDNEIAHGCLGDAYRAEKAYDEAMAEYRTALAIKPNYLAAMINLGSVLGTVGRLDEAIVTLNEATRLKHDDPDARNALGLALALRGNIASALEQFEVAALLKPDSVMAHTQLGKTYGNLGRFDDAITEFSIALRLEPDSAEARAGLDKAVAAKNRPREN
jgi:tetratricopeptide (TPR) repeat protein